MTEEIMNAEISEEARRAELSEQHRVRMEKMEALRAQQAAQEYLLEMGL